MNNDLTLYKRFLFFFLSFASLSRWTSIVSRDNNRKSLTLSFLALLQPRNTRSPAIVTGAASFVSMLCGGGGERGRGRGGCGYGGFGLSALFRSVI